MVCLALGGSGCEKEKEKKGKEAEVTEVTKAPKVPEKPKVASSEVVGAYSGELRPKIKDLKVTPETYKDLVTKQLEGNVKSEAIKIALEKNPNNSTSVLLKEFLFPLSFTSGLGVENGMLFNVEPLDKGATVKQEGPLVVTFKGGAKLYCLLENGRATAMYDAYYDKAKQTFNFATEMEIKFSDDINGEKVECIALVEAKSEGKKQ